jgi:hypothetical protein
MNSRLRICSERSWATIRALKGRAELMATGLKPQNNPEESYSGLLFREEGHSGLLRNRRTLQGSRHMMQRRPTATGLAGHIHTCPSLIRIANRARDQGLEDWTTRCNNRPQPYHHLLQPGKPAVCLEPRIHGMTPQGAVNVPALPSVGHSPGAALHSQSNQNH